MIGDSSISENFPKSDGFCELFLGKNADHFTFNFFKRVLFSFPVTGTVGCLYRKIIVNFQSCLFLVNHYVGSDAIWQFAKRGNLDVTD